MFNNRQSILFKFNCLYSVLYHACHLNTFYSSYLVEVVHRRERPDIKPIL